MFDKKIMSRLGKRVIILPEGVNFHIDPDFKYCKIVGPLGTLAKTLSGYIPVLVKDNRITTKMPNASQKAKIMVGTVNSLLHNWIYGVVHGYKKVLFLKGLGYKVRKVNPQLLEFNLGFSHPIQYPIPDKISVELIKNNQIIVQGMDKELVGLFASKIRQLKKAEPYKGKGIIYEGENVQRKVGKSSAAKK